MVKGSTNGGDLLQKKTARKIADFDSSSTTKASTSSEAGSSTAGSSTRADVSSSGTGEDTSETLNKILDKSD